jgi:hypothetical protein
MECNFCFYAFCLSPIASISFVMRLYGGFKANLMSEIVKSEL